MNNTGSALLILGVTYFGITYGWQPWNYGGIILGILSWLFTSSKAHDQGLDLVKAQADFYRYELPKLVRALTAYYTGDRTQ